MQGYNKHLHAKLVKGFREGFRLGYVGTPSNTFCDNHKSATVNHEAVYLKLAKESLAGRVAGPFSAPPFSPFVCSPLGLVPKSDGKFRLIHDLSFPKKSSFSVNGSIPHEASVVSYDTMDNVVSLIKQYGQFALMAKTDVENAFCIIPIHPSDYHLLGFSWNNYFYYDRTLPMGASSSCQIFEMLSTALQWIMENKYSAGGMAHMLDDFLFIGEPYSPSCGRNLQNFISLCNKLGIPINQEKTVLPTTVLTIFGIEVDTNLMECRLPQEKIDKIKTTLLQFSRRKKVTLRELQSLIGLLNFACSVICPGRAFLRRLIDLTMGVRESWYKIRLNSEIKADILLWQSFIDQFNGKSVFYSDEWLTSNTLSLYTDAAGSLGFAGVLGSKWFAMEWPSDLQSHQIAIKEMFPIVIALELWGETLKNSKVLFFSDNSAVVHTINKQSCKDKTLMRLVRRLVLSALKYNIWFKSKHIPGASNIIADLLSRLQFQKARQKAPWLDNTPVDLPPNLLMI